MELGRLKDHVRALATLEETEAPVISCYVNLEKGKSGFRPEIQRRIGLIKPTLDGERLELFNDALGKVEHVLSGAILPDAKGMAVFAREGEHPFLSLLRFSAPLPNSFTVDGLPSIYHLIELKDTYHRYVVMISTEDHARIIEVNLGAVTESVWDERPELRARVGREWTKQHYQNHRRDRTDRFIKEKVALLDRLMSKGGYSHLILAGSRSMTTRIEKSLPKHLADKLIDIMDLSGKASISRVVADTLQRFIEQEEKESQAAVERLVAHLHTSGLAAVGSEQSREALLRGQADQLVLSRSDSNQHREELVRLAERSGCHIEIVADSPLLDGLGGVGCVLRYLTAEQHARRE